MHHLSQHQQHQQHLARGGTTQPRPDAHPRRIHCLTTTTHRHRVTPKQQQAPRVDPTCQPSTSSSSWQASTSSRRGLVLRSVTLLPPLLLVGSDDATTIVNSILSGYGLPTLTPSKGFKPYDEFEDDYLFEYPRSWVARRNSMRPGVYISDFQTADKVAVEVLDPPADGDVRTAAVAAAVIPPGRQEDATLNLPAQRLIKSAPATVDGQEYLYLEFPSQTITRSGYNIKRKNFVVAGLKHDKLYVLSASARSDQYNPEKKDMLQHIVQSFRLR